ncbi:hypothetical protein [Desulforamulus ruminis]|uniref:hypothetical protein n=1 Tax=Desulforamulus ruminis TaxID=1564 RepID=UPI0002D557B7|nr:hypothetical protein [Desulforamulus ruminis]
MAIDRKEKIVLYAPDEDCLGDIEITGDSTNVGQYSDKRFHSSLQWNFTEKRAEQLLEYIAEHLKTAAEIELWNIWLDEYDAPTIVQRSLKELTVADIKAVLGQKIYKKPACLVVRL